MADDQLSKMQSRWTPGIIVEQQAVLDSVHNFRSIYREHWQLRDNEVERNRLFDALEAEAGDLPN